MSSLNGRSANIVLMLIAPKNVYILYLGRVRSRGPAQGSSQAAARPTSHNDLLHSLLQKDERFHALAAEPMRLPSPREASQLRRPWPAPPLTAWLTGRRDFIDWATKFALSSSFLALSSSISSSAKSVIRASACLNAYAAATFSSACHCSAAASACICASATAAFCFCCCCCC